MARSKKVKTDEFEEHGVDSVGEPDTIYSTDEEEVMTVASSISSQAKPPTQTRKN
jgi:hypothetical protein